MAAATDAFTHRDRCAIVGIGATDFSRDSGRSELTLATQAARAALDDAGLTVADIDGIVRCDFDSVTHNALSASLGIRGLSYWGEVGPGGVAPCAMVGQAIGAILSGQASTVLLYRCLNGRSDVRFSAGTAPTVQRPVGGKATYDEFYIPYGLMTPGQLFALMAQRHTIEYGTTPEQLGEIALTCRANANDTPHAQTAGRKLTMSEYLASRMISAPLRLFDFCLESDGACAVIVTSAARARDLRQPPVLIRAVAQGAAADTRGGMMYTAVTRKSLVELPAYTVANKLYERAGLGPQDIDVAQIYDCFTISVLMQLEAFGFCEPGAGGPFVASGAIRRDGSVPINTAGGHLSEGYIHGMNHIVEATRQMRGTGAVQVADAETCLVTGGPFPTSSALILRKA